MSSRTAASFTLCATMLAACSDPLDDEPKGQTIPTHAELATSYAAGSAPVAGGGGSGSAAPAGAASGMPAGLVSQSQGASAGGAAGSLPPAGLQTAPGGTGTQRRTERCRTGRWWRERRWRLGWRMSSRSALAGLPGLVRKTRQSIRMARQEFASRCIRRDRSP